MKDWWFGCLYDAWIYVFFYLFMLLKMHQWKCRATKIPISKHQIKHEIIITKENSHQEFIELNHYITIVNMMPCRALERPELNDLIKQLPHRKFRLSWHCNNCNCASPKLTWLLSSVWLCFYCFICSVQQLCVLFYTIVINKFAMFFSTTHIF